MNLYLLSRLCEPPVAVVTPYMTQSGNTSSLLLLTWKFTNGSSNSQSRQECNSKGTINFSSVSVVRYKEMTKNILSNHSVIALFFSTKDHSL